MNYTKHDIVKGCARRKGIDFDETYLPIRYNSIKYLFAVNLNLRADQIDAITTFLQRELKHKIYK